MRRLTQFWHGSRRGCKFRKATASKEGTLYQCGYFGKKPASLFEALGSASLATNPPATRDSRFRCVQARQAWRTRRDHDVS